MLQEGIYALLSADAGVTALVDPTHIFAVAVPDDQLPDRFISYSFVGGSSEPTLSTSGLLRQRVELNAFAVNPCVGQGPAQLAARIRAAIIDALNGWQQTLDDGTRVLNAVLLNPGTDFVMEQRIFRCMVEFYVLYTLP